MKKLLVSVCATILLSGCIETGRGEKIGQITKVAEEGLICMTWEGQIIRGGLTNGSGVSGQAFDFTIENNPVLVEKIQNLMNEQKEIKLKYRSEAISFCRSESNHFVVDVEELNPTKPDTIKSVDSKVETKIDTSDKQDKILSLLKLQNELINELITK